MKCELTPYQIKKMKKQEQEKQQQQEQQNRIEKQRQEFLPFLMTTFGRVFKTDDNASLKVEDGFFDIEMHDENHHGVFKRIAPEYQSSTQDYLNELNQICDRIDQIREQERLDEQARQVALAKLTNEEMKLLGIRRTRIVL